MQVVPLTYELLNANQADLVARYKEYVPKMWVTRKDYKPEYDLVTVAPPEKAGSVATVFLSIIELALCIDVFSKRYKQMIQQTKLFKYAVYENSVIERLTTTVWGHQPEATAYSGAVAEWASALRHPTLKIASTVPQPPQPAEPAVAQEGPLPGQLEEPTKVFTPVPPPGPKPQRVPTDTFCPKGEKHMYSEPTICGYSWHGPVRAANCINCGYHWTDH